MCIRDSLGTKGFLVGSEATARLALLNIRYPSEYGVVKDWDAMEAVWTHCYFNELREDPDARRVLITESPFNPRANREKTLEIFFEKFHVPAFFFQIPGVLALFASGRSTGLVLDAGDGCTHAVPVHEGFARIEAIQRVPFGGRDLNYFLAKTLMEDGVYMNNTSSEKTLVKDIKEKKCWVAPDFEAAQRNKCPRVDFECPDGKVISFEDQQFRIPELLFQPKRIGRNCLGVHEVAHQAAIMCEAPLRKELYANLVLAGGTSQMAGFAERVQSEVQKLAGNANKVNVITPIDRAYSAWLGGAIVATLPAFEDMWITRTDYDEYGAQIVHSKCPVSAKQNKCAIDGLRLE
eukprot:TRINITY_DN3786_c0_g1_i1.p1 TRINITY_DN3786_c0_g1~~TRINITY_DN3786_c0_g1_i1.p1  ORF type:complete len:368 (-),score=109.24 TRINITY_DN3786_c0_g1_i1:261-1307(-)